MSRLARVCGAQWLQNAACGFGAVALSAMWAEEGLGTEEQEKGANHPLTPKPTHFPAKAKRVIYLYMDGGPSQVDTFDPKPRLTRDNGKPFACLLYTSPSPRDKSSSRMPSSA